MRCLRCNREVEDGQVFCDQCLSQMEGQPVKPGTPVILPKRPPSTPRRPLNSQDRPEEQVAKLQKQVHRLHGWIAFWIVLSGLAIGLLTFRLSTGEEGFGLGQNYSPMEPSSSQTGRP